VFNISKILLTFDGDSPKGGNASKILFKILLLHNIIFCQMELILKLLVITFSDGLCKLEFKLLSFVEEIWKKMKFQPPKFILNGKSKVSFSEFLRNKKFQVSNGTHGLTLFTRNLRTLQQTFVFRIHRFAKFRKKSTLKRSRFYGVYPLNNLTHS